MGFRKLITKVRSFFRQHSIFKRKKPQSVTTADSTSSNPTMDNSTETASPDSSRGESGSSTNDESAIIPTVGSGPAADVQILNLFPVNRFPPNQNVRSGDIVDDNADVRVIHRVPLYTDIKALEDFASSLPYLKDILCTQVSSTNRNYDVYLKFEIHSPISQVLTKEVVIDGMTFKIARCDGQYHRTMYAESISLLARDETQASGLPQGCSRFTYIAGVLPPNVCHWCADEIARKDLHTPCIECEWPICADCLRQSFQVAMRDHEAFPARCCYLPIHPGITQGILTDTERAKYRARFEEMCTKKPLYCANPTCSTFIPPRTMQIVNGKVVCHECGTETCRKCRREAIEGHECSTLTAEEADMLDQFGYKRCPNCGAGMARMHGCSHMRCPCGTHWCWDCAAVSSRCTCDVMSDHAVSEDEDSVWDEEESDDEAFDDEILHAERVSDANTQDDQEEIVSSRTSLSHARTLTGETDDDDVVAFTKGETQYTERELLAAHAMLGIATHIEDARPVVISGTVEAVDIPQDPQEGQMAESMDSDADAQMVGAGPSTAAPINLDRFRTDPSGQLWEASPMNFGQDPADTGNEPWTCAHQFDEFHRDHIPKYWMAPGAPHWRDLGADGSWEREIDCMLCQRGMKVSQPGAAISDQKLVAYQCPDCGILSCGRCRARTERRRERRGE